jgi:membrane associated rhomboid family serine protease
MFFFPLRDDNPTQRRPIISYLILAICVLVFGWQLSLGALQHDAVVAFGMIPARLFGYEVAEQLPYQTIGWVTVFTSMFMHGGFMHLAGNMLYLWIFADNIEDSLGRVRFIIFYLLCGVGAALAQASMDVQSLTPMIGASGAIAGVLGGYLLLHPRANVRCVAGFFIFFRVINVPAFIVLGIWIGLQFINLGQTGSGIAYLAHIGGFAAGMVLIPFFKKADVPLFNKPQSRAFEVTQTIRPAAHIPTIRRARQNPWDE